MSSSPRPSRRHMRRRSYPQSPLNDISSIWTLLYGKPPNDLVAFRAEEADLARNPQKRVELKNDNWRRGSDLISFIKARVGRRPGNPYSIPNREVRELAKKVDAAKKRWRRENGKQHVPSAVTDRIMDAKIPTYIPRDSGSYANWKHWIRNALKAMHF